MKEYLNLTSSDHNADNVERYFQALAVSTRANAAVIADLIELHDSDKMSRKVKWTLVNALGSIAYRFAHDRNQKNSSKPVQDVQKLFTDSLVECSDEVCRETYLNGLQNLQSVDTIGTIFKFVDSKARSVAVAAIKALKAFPKGTWTSEHVRRFEDIFFQYEKRYDSSIRTLALDILLQLSLNDVQLANIVSHLKSDDKAFEVKKYLLEEIRMIAAEKDTFKSLVDGIIRKDKTLNNYHVIGQKGLSTALARPYSVLSPYNATLKSVQETSAGVLKRGVVDLTIDTPDESFSLFGVRTVLALVSLIHEIILKI